MRTINPSNQPDPWRLRTDLSAFTMYSLESKKPHTEVRGFEVGWLMGLEPTTLGTTNRCSNQLSYSHRFTPKGAQR
jgi:hypothetical protein